MNTKTITIGLVVVLLIVGGFFLLKKQATAPVSPETETPVENEVLISESGKLKVFSPKKDVLLNSTFTVTGEARLWYFEGSFPVYLYDSTGAMVAAGPATAKGDWMTTEFVPFEGTLTVSADAKPGKGYILFTEDNPAGDEERKRPLDTFKLPVNIPSFETMTVKVYFGTETAVKSDCSVVSPINRKILKTTAVGKSALETLIKGPTQLERQNGYISEIPNYVRVNSLNIVNGVAKVDLSDMYVGGGSCKVGMIKSQIESTLKQFETVKSVEVSINGKSDILEP